MLDTVTRWTSASAVFAGIAGIAGFAIAAACSSFDSTAVDGDAGPPEGGRLDVEVGVDVDADAGSRPDAPPSLDAAPDGAKESVVHCGGSTVTCGLPSEICCAGAGGYECRTTSECSCVEAGSCTQLYLECDDVTDCPGATVCCATIDSQGYIQIGATCRDPTNCASPAVRLCDPQLPTTSSGCAGGSCSPLLHYAGVGSCGS